MARRPYSVEIPKLPDPLIVLSQNILTKHNADGAVSPIPDTLASMLTDKLAVAKAQVTLQGDLDKDKERYIEGRNLALGLDSSQSSITEGTALFYVTSIRNFLLGLFRGSERKLGDWGFSVNSPKGRVQVEIPRSPEKLIKLGKAIVKKHEEDASSSIIASFDLDALKTCVTDAELLNSQAASANRNKGKATEARNLALGIAKGQNSKTMGTAAYIVRSIRDILLGMYRGREQQLGDWGFEVNFNATHPPSTQPA